MPWNSVSPLGTISVKSNRTPMNQNTTYIETTMGNSVVGTNTATTRDHFWNVGSNEDGRHRFMQSPKFTVGAVAADPVLGTGMDGVLYLKQPSATATNIEGFYRNSQGIYQYIPAFLSGTHVVTSSYTTIVTIPANVYGEIVMYTTTDDGSTSGAIGHFSSIFAAGTKTYAWSLTQTTNSSATSQPLKFGNGSSASGLDLVVRTSDASNGLTWNYRITYRAI